MFVIVYDAIMDIHNEFSFPFLFTSSMLSIFLCVLVCNFSGRHQFIFCSCDDEISSLRLWKFICVSASEDS